MNDDLKTQADEITGTAGITNAIAQTIEGELITRDQIREIQRVDVLSPVLSVQQLDVLLAPTPTHAIKVREGRGGKMFKYVPHGYVTDTLNKAFGFHWDLVITPIDGGGKLYALQIEETPVMKSGKPTGETRTQRYIAVSGYIKVYIHDPNDPKSILAMIQKDGFGSQEWLPTMEFGDALKAARSDLIKTCAFQLGVALDLYYNEQAEIQQYNLQAQQKEAARVAKAEAEAEFQTKMSGVPQDGASLLARSMSEYNISALDIGIQLGVEVPAIIVMDAAGIADLWEKIKTLTKP